MWILTPQEYFQQHWGHVSAVHDFVDSLQQQQLQGSAGEATAGAAPPHFPPHWTQQAVEEGLTAGVLLQVGGAQYRGGRGGHYWVRGGLTTGVKGGGCHSWVRGGGLTTGVKGGGVTPGGGGGGAGTIGC